MGKKQSSISNPEKAPSEGSQGLRLNFYGLILAFAAIILTFAGLIIAYAAIEKPTPNPSSVSPSQMSNELPTIERIDFDYSDSPTNHGWVFHKDGASENQLTITPIHNPAVGWTISILHPSGKNYGMDYEITNEASENGNVIEFVVEMGSDSAVYAYVNLIKSNGLSQKGWLQFCGGPGDSRPLLDKTSTPPKL